MNTQAGIPDIRDYQGYQLRVLEVYLVISDIANNARYDGIRNILGIPGILGLGIIQDMRGMSNIRGILIV